mmetsp:Transcript_2696/g.7425  ORF Transcript_2696/g.7425 Transcript_2696/m.7425 type:complete len:224 (+) Transcript_2696:53-724(+)|eukprot:CAMPEP_0119125692 /NCGR_PEP_ID=MMETSP1310-20130426/4884_1 /TAXON_ID=464262 /ORGANISM="Genus nov. species nov., Strain RCC2339" /LENGTH=223 /DNA_ID=CAMNT_0007115787 /DNA_START=47 /DNA_END=718 /DNA_ORIENTATION=-
MAEGKVKAVLFDVGGVIAGNLHWFEGTEELCDAEALEAMGKVRKEEWMKLKTDEGYGVQTFWENVLKAGGLEGKRTWQEMDAKLQEGFRVFDSTVQVIRQLRAKGYIVGVISNHSHEWFNGIFDRYDVHAEFPDQALVIVSCYARCAKPDKAIFTHAWNRLQAKYPDLRPNEVVFVDDQERNAEACREHVGWHTIHFNVEVQDPSTLTAGLAALGITDLTHGA